MCGQQHPNSKPGHTEHAPRREKCSRQARVGRFGPLLLVSVHRRRCEGRNRSGRCCCNQRITTSRSRLVVSRWSGRNSGLLSLRPLANIGTNASIRPGSSMPVSRCRITPGIALSIGLPHGTSQRSSRTNPYESRWRLLAPLIAGTWGISPVVHAGIFRHLWVGCERNATPFRYAAGSASRGRRLLC